MEFEGSSKPEIVADRLFGWTIFLELTPLKVLPLVKQEMVQVKMSGLK
jgi:hypothetical protein